MGLYVNPDNRIFNESLNSAIYVDKSMLLIGVSYDKKMKKHECKVVKA